MYKIPCSISSVAVASFILGVGSAFSQTASTAPPRESGSLITFTLSSPSIETDEQQLEAVLREEDADSRHLMLTALGMNMGKTNPKEGWGFVLKKFTSLRDREVYWMALLRSWGESQPQEALKACEDIQAGEQRSMAYSGAVEGWAKTAAKEAAEWSVKNLPRSYRRAALGRIGQVWGQKNPKEAAEWAMLQFNEIDRIFVLSEVLESWADLYAPNAATWAGKLPLGKFRDLMVSKAVLRWADYFPQAAAEWLMENPETDWLLPRVLAKWAAHDRANATIWLGKVTDESLTRQCSIAIVQECALYDPEGAADWALANLHGEDLSIALGQVCQGWGSEYPLEALRWAAKLQPESERINATQSILQAWAVVDSEQFSRWASEQPPGLDKDLGAVQLADLLARQDENAALQALMNLQNPALRQGAMLEMFEDWKSRDEDAANAWLQKNPAAAAAMKP